MSRDFSTRSTPTRRRADIKWLILLLLPLFVTTGLAVARWRRAAAMESRLEDLRRENAAQEARLKGLMSSLNVNGNRLVNNVIASPPRIVTELATLLPGDVRIERLDIEYQDAVRVTLHVLARRASSYDLFLSRLEESPRFRQVRGGEESREGELQVVIRVLYEPSPPT